MDITPELFFVLVDIADEHPSGYATIARATPHMGKSMQHWVPLKQSQVFSAGTILAGGSRECTNITFRVAAHALV